MEDKTRCIYISGKSPGGISSESRQQCSTRFQPAEYPERMRGHVEIQISSCICCGLCARSCSFDSDQGRQSGREHGTIDRFDCVQCGSCVAACPKKCLSMAKGYTEPGVAKKSETFIKPKEEQPAAAASGGGKPSVDVEKCVYCTLCAKKCPTGGDPGGPERKDLETGRRKMCAVRDLCIGMSETCDRDVG